MDNLWNDIVYTDVMQSDGFVVDYAVLTTYSLDMSSLLSVPFMLGALTDLTEAAMRAPHLVLEAVNRSAGKFTVFCNAGCIAVPKVNSKLYALLERSVIQLALPAKGAAFVNFHPKVWVIRETNPDTGERQLKVVVLSRNLSQSNDLDVVCELKGRITTKPSSAAARQKHRPLADFLEWLYDRSIHKKIRRQIRGLISDLEHVERFDLTDSPFDDYDFFPMGIDGYNGQTHFLESQMLQQAGEMVVISPFIDQKTLGMMVEKRPKSRRTLITRHASVTREILPLFNDGVFVPKEVLTDKVEKEVTVDIHEKVYFVRHAHTGFNYLFLGSTNATQNGFNRNVELLLRLKFASYKSSYDQFRAELIHDGKDAMFEQVTAVLADPPVQEQVADELALRKTIAAIQRAEVHKQDAAYIITIHCKTDKLPQDEVHIYPLGSAGLEARLTDGITFEDLELSMLTEFYVLTVGNVQRVIKIETRGVPVEERDRSIFRSLINTKGKFISYLTFMLTDDACQYMMESQQMERELSNVEATASEQEISISLYEDMVRTAYTAPDRIAAIRSIIEKADSAVIPAHFAELYASFETTIKQIRRL